MMVCCAKFIACQLLNVPRQKQNPEIVHVLVFNAKKMQKSAFINTTQNIT